MEFLKSRVYCSQTQLGEVKWGEVSNLDSIMPCPSMGPKLFWTTQIKDPQDFHAYSDIS